MTRFRGFIAVDIPATPKIQEVTREIKQTKAQVKLVEPENIHITLKFLGDADEHLITEIEHIMSNTVQDVQPFHLTLKHTGVFPNKNYMKVIWIGIEDITTLATIAARLENQLEPLGFLKEKRGFSAHLTIGRVKTAEHKDKLLEIIERYADDEFGEFTIDTITLKKSDLTPQGPIYTTLKETKFQK